MVSIPFSFRGNHILTTKAPLVCCGKYATPAKKIQDPAVNRIKRGKCT
jgi:hypothetical protein